MRNLRSLFFFLHIAMSEIVARCNIQLSEGIRFPSPSLIESKRRMCREESMKILDSLERMFPGITFQELTRQEQSDSYVFGAEGRPEELAELARHVRKNDLGNMRTGVLQASEDLRVAEPQ